MFDKLLTWGGNALLGCALVLLAAQQPALAQEPEPDDPVGGVSQAEGTLSVPLSGTATVSRVANFAVTPNGFDTGLVEIGQSKTVTVTLSHTGGGETAPISIGRATLFGRDANEYLTAFNGFLTLNPGDSQAVSVTFTPVVSGAKSAGLMLDVDGASAPVVVLLDGSARYPFVAEIGASATDLNFGQVVEGGKLGKVLTLQNTGDPGAPPLFVSGVQKSGDFPADFTVTFQPVSIPQGGSVDVPIELTAGLEGTKTALLEFLHDGNNGTLEVALQGQVVKPSSVPVGFDWSAFEAGIDRGTGIDFGPDGKLYVAQMDGSIKVFDAVRNGKNNYGASLVETINLVKNVPNHDDDGSPVNLGERLVTGIHLAGTAAQPIIWIASSDPRQGAGPSGLDKNLDTNSGILHKLTKNGGGWQKQDVVRGLPRSEENHASNGIAFKNGKLILMSGGFTNQGVPSNNFAEISEYALSAAALEIDVNAIGGGTYDLPTLDDPSRGGNPDANDPFGGNDGANQAILEANGPVKIFSAGLRNAYDVVHTQSGKVYTFDNGPNTGWGGVPNDCSNGVDNGGKHGWDQLHLLEKGSYHGHPNPVRGSKNNTFNGQSPIEGAADSRECVYKKAGEDGALTTIGASSNGIDEYTATNFAGSVSGDLMVAAYGKNVWRIELNGAGNAVTSKNVVANFDSDDKSQVPLDLTAQGDGDPFPGTIWVVDNVSSKLYVLEPDDY